MRKDTQKPKGRLPTINQHIAQIAGRDLDRAQDLLAQAQATLSNILSLNTDKIIEAALEVDQARTLYDRRHQEHRAALKKLTNWELHHL